MQNKWTKDLAAILPIWHSSENYTVKKRNLIKLKSALFLNVLDGVFVDIKCRRLLGGLSGTVILHDKLN